MVLHESLINSGWAGLLTAGLLTAGQKSVKKVCAIYVII